MATSIFSLPGVDLNNATSLAVYYETHAIPQRFNAGVVVASLAVSILGSYATLYIMGKRTGNSGIRNIFLLILAATTMAFVGIWGMHFIGMYMRLAPTPTMNWYINYNAGFTVFSLIAPAIALIFSFLFLDHAMGGFQAWKVVVAGTLTGCTVALMHYSASFYCNYLVTFKAGQVVGSILLAALLCTVGLTAFFRFRSQWQDSWWKRTLCAFTLGAGVSSMHYIGVSGTSYRVRPENSNDVASLAMGKKRNDILVIVIGVTCFIVVVGSSFTAFSEFFVVRESRKKARKLVVASATFDRSGRLMVQGDGTLPLITIEERTLRRSQVLDALDQRSNIFQWLYAISWDWNIITSFLPAIAQRVFELEKQEYCANQRDTLTRSQKARRVLSKRKSLTGEVVMQNQTTISLLDFRDKVVDAARRLAKDLDVPLPALGVFYDTLLPTGTKKVVESAVAMEAYKKDLDTANHRSGHAGAHSDDEASVGSRTTSIFGQGGEDSEGATIFIVREVGQEQFNQLAKKGYRFTETKFLSSVLADRHGVVKEEMESTLTSLRVYAKRGTKPVVQPGGVYTGLFGVRSNAAHRHGQLDVLVYDFAHHQIPAYRLPGVRELTSEMTVFLKSVDQMPMQTVMTACEMASLKATEERGKLTDYLRMLKLQESAERLQEMMILREEEESLAALIHFHQAFFSALDALHQSVRFFPQILTTARVSAEVLELPSSLEENTATAKVILVQVVLPTDREAVRASMGQFPMPSEKPTPGLPFVFTPYTLFAKSQMMMLRGQSADDFENDVREELQRRYKVQDVDTSLSSTYDDDGKWSEFMSEKSLMGKQKHKQAGAGNRLREFIVNIPMVQRKSDPAVVIPMQQEVGTHGIPATPPSAQVALETESLGIRRFIATGKMPFSSSVPDQSRFARATESQDHIEVVRVSSARTDASESKQDGFPSPPRRTTSKATIVQQTKTLSFVPPSARRPSGTSGEEGERVPSSGVRLRFDNWQSKQLEELERRQPDLFLGILPSEY